MGASLALARALGLRSALRRTALGAGVLLAAALPGVSSATPPGAVPVRCETLASTGEFDTFTCRRQDTDASFTQVPTGKFLHVTDVLANRNTLADTGDFYMSIGRDEGLGYPSRPRIDLSGTPREATALHFKTPVLVLEEGESFGAYNDVSSDFPLNVYVSGYLAASGSL